MLVHSCTNESYIATFETQIWSVKEWGHIHTIKHQINKNDNVSEVSRSPQYMKKLFDPDSEPGKGIGDQEIVKDSLRNVPQIHYYIYIVFF